jgi:hypothetical protein
MLKSMASLSMVKESGEANCLNKGMIFHDD